MFRYIFGLVGFFNVVLIIFLGVFVVDGVEAVGDAAGFNNLLYLLTCYIFIIFL